jgi:drug/metabolite transporter (DMT)-like permease
MLYACVAMALVGGAVTASSYLTDAPRSGAQAVRYLAAAGVLAALHSRRPTWQVVRPAGREWWWLIAAATAGLSAYNLAVVHALDHAEPTAVATVISGVPLALAIGAPLVAGRSVPLPLVGAAVAVVAGAALVQGGGRSDGVGIALSLVALAGESGFTLLSLPVLPRLGAFSVATHTSWIAAAQLSVLALVRDGRHALPAPDPAVVAAITYLVAASAIAFALWFLAVAEVGGDLAGLAAGIIPITAIATGLPLGVASVDAAAVGGAVLVATGLVVGLRHARPAPSASRGCVGGRARSMLAVAPQRAVPATAATCAAPVDGPRPDRGGPC